MCNVCHNNIFLYMGYILNSERRKTCDEQLTKKNKTSKVEY